MSQPNHKFLVTFLCALIVFPMLNDIPEVTNPFMPTLFTMLLSYSCAYSVMAVYDISVDTILLCTLVDEKANKSVNQVS
jgi:hypothetical protein